MVRTITRNKDARQVGGYGVIVSHKVTVGIYFKLIGKNFGVGGYGRWQ